ncbi:SusC/RagA family TonB-linked outer membrane protein [Dinghuibacter silviterrae]|uniref:TonB-linked SusC/RagA family outer membrane protein n=1 Tax=Dinghuibacter silviterrae TaxID=1539049 RepID=A0A4V3GKX8_9BACT|nr:SusC/RagA family TonB-linked outer membrane protein [Dinghuibacter silviterrae]TDW97372.1 TonB-linked SusC/RagA family outer membrane protein [Dinghuibacter silviterrae]
MKLRQPKFPWVLGLFLFLQAHPTAAQSTAPVTAPSAAPVTAPSAAPAVAPSAAPAAAPSAAPAIAPSAAPAAAPSARTSDTLPPAKDTTKLPGSDSVKTVVADTTPAKPAAHAVAPPARAAAGAAADTLPKKPSFKGPEINGIVSGPNDYPLDSANVTTAGGLAIRAAADGSFKAPFVKGSFLLVSRRGYETVKVVMTAPGAILMVKLAKSATKEIQEVTVTALGISQKSRAVGYSIQEVGGQEVAVAKETNFVDALQGKLAGVNINANNGSMGGSTKVTIRGNKSITQTNDAIYVVDGVFMNNENVNSVGQQIGGGGYDYGSPIQDINPDDIQEISVLKGAAASALYGSRGQNGVILVTTKKGAPGRKFGVDYSLNVEAQQVYVLPKFQNEYGAGIGNSFDTLWYNQNPQYFKSPTSPAYSDPVRGGYDLMPQYSVDESWGPKLNGQLIRAYYSFDQDKGNPFFDQLTPWSPQPNNVKDFFNTGVTVNNSIAFGGSDDKATYRFSYGNMAQKFILPNSNQVRNNLSINASYKVNPWLTSVVAANYVSNNATGRPGTGFTGANPMLNFVEYGQRQLEDAKLRYYKFPDGTQLSWNRTSFSNPAPAFDDNIYWIRYMEPETDSRNRLFGQAGFDLKPVSWLTIQARIFMDMYHILQEERTAKDYFAGSYTRTDRQFQELDYQLLATARKNLDKNWDLNVTAGGNVEQQNDQYNTGAIPISEGLIIPGLYTLSNANGPVIYSGDIVRKQINSVFATGTLGYRDLLFLDVTGRNDWTSALAPGHNAYFYPSAALAFVFSDLLKARWLSFGKLRTSWAQIGNDITPYSIYDTYSAPGLFGTEPTMATNPVKNNPNLKPERSTEYEEGLEARFFRDRIGLDFTWYDRTTRDLIIPMQITPTTGYTNVYVNAGAVRNRGIEVELSGRPLDLKRFSWDIGINFARNSNKVTQLTVPNNPSQNEIVIATERRLHSVSDAAIKGQSLFALTGTDYTYLNGQKVVDSTGLYVPSAPGQVIGHTAPDFTGGVTNTLRWGNLSLSVLVDFQHGGNFFSYTNLYGEYSGTLAVTAANGIRENGIVAQGVYKDGSPNTTNIPAMTYFDADQGKRVNKANVYDASYVYLREVRLGYSLPAKWAERLKADALRLSLYGRNLWLIHSNAPNVDPSNIVNSDSNVQGLEGGALPSVRTFGLNLTASF